MEYRHTHRLRVAWEQRKKAWEMHYQADVSHAMRQTGKQVVRLQTYTDRPLIFDDVLVRVSPDFATRVHLDYDEANACGYRGGDLGRILS